MGRGPEGIEAEVDAAVAAARKAFDGGDWSDLAPAARADIMDRFMGELAARGEPLAAAVSAQNGMPIAPSSQLEAQFPLGVLQYYSGLARTMGAADVRPSQLGKETLVARAAHGVVPPINPWTFPVTLAPNKNAPGP